MVGIAITFLSFLFFARQHETYSILLICGLILSLLFFLRILFGKTSLKAKLLVTGIVIVSIAVQQMTELNLIDTSYKIYITKKKAVLDEVNTILLSKDGNVSILGETFSDSSNLSNSEINKLKESRKKLGVYMISKTENSVYYGLWGFLDVRLGISYLTQKPTADKGKRHLKGSWYR